MRPNPLIATRTVMDMILLRCYASLLLFPRLFSASFCALQQFLDMASYSVKRGAFAMSHIEVSAD
jgi:hypothetical protein